jgi:hypothetical protein
MNRTCGNATGPDEWDWSYPKAYCKYSATREYRVRGSGTVSDASGVWGAVTDWKYAYLACVS